MSLYDISEPMQKAIQNGDEGVQEFVGRGRIITVGTGGMRRDRKASCKTFGIC